MKKGIFGALLVSMLSACGTGMDTGPVDSAGQKSEETGSSEAALCSPYVYDFTYYTDCTRTTVVGYETLNCNGQRFLTGTKTRFYDADISDLCAPCGTFPYSGTCH